MFKLVLAISAISFFIACSGGPYPISADPRAKTLIGKSWKLYSDDIIDTNNGKSDYVSRRLAASSGTTVSFVSKDTLTQVDTYLDQEARTVQGHWNWYPIGTMIAELKTDIMDEPFKDLYKLQDDTMQLSVRPFYYTDSLDNRWYLRVKTFIAQR